MRKFLIIFVICFAFVTAFEEEVLACNYSVRNDTLNTCSNNCIDPHLRTARNIYVHGTPSRRVIMELRSNVWLETLRMDDMSGLTEKDIDALYGFLANGDIATAGILFSYEHYHDSFNDDGTALYQRTLEQQCPEVITKRSCASVVSAAMCAAGCSDYGSEGVQGIIDYFAQDDNGWVDLGRLTKEQMLPGDVVFIDRRSHALEYLSGELSDSEFEADEELIKEYEYDAGYDENGIKDYSEKDPTGAPEEVFNPDQNEDGDISEWEAEYWKLYWDRVHPYQSPPGYDYYETWKAEAEEKEKQRIAEAEEAEREREERIAKARAKVIHDHIFVWTGEEKIKSRYPDSKGNIVSGSYTENYSLARSAAVSEYDFAGDYKVYRYMPVREELPLSNMTIFKEIMKKWAEKN